MIKVFNRYSHAITVDIVCGKEKTEVYVQPKATVKLEEGFSVCPVFLANNPMLYVMDENGKPLNNTIVKAETKTTKSSTPKITKVTDTAKTTETNKEDK